MTLTDISVKRPVFASVISLLLIAFGIVSFQQLPLREYPNIDPPIVTVEVSYPGAPANIVETQVTQLIEDRIAGIEGIDYIDASSQDGRSNVTLFFSTNRDVQEASNDVRDKLSRIVEDLPEDAEAAEIEKVDSNEEVIIWQNLVSNDLSVAELTDYARRYLVHQYSSLDGVARVRVGGGLDYAIRIWLDHHALTARGLTPNDIAQAVRNENLESPAGSLETKQQVIQMRLQKPFVDPEDFEKLVVKTLPSGEKVRLGDVARVRLGVEEARTLFRGNLIPMVGIGVIRQSTSNTIDVARQVKALSARLNPNLPDGMTIEQSYDASVFIESSILEVYKTLAFAILCVMVVIYLFIGRLSIALIPALTLPVAIIATFSVIFALGFTVNLLTLLALVLGIGLVVDDAIVVIENMTSHLERGGSSPLVAAYKGSREVGFAVIATTLVLVSVFVPLTFLEGDLGRLFSEFAITLSASVLFSSLVALTLVPVLFVKFQKLFGGSSSKQDSKSAQYNFVVRWFHGLVKAASYGYIASLKWATRWYGVIILSFLAVVGIGFYGFQKLPTSFIPNEDRGAFFLLVNGPEGANYEFMEEAMDTIEERMMPYVESGEINRLLVRAPRGFGSIENFNSGIVIVVLNDWDKRRPADVIMKEIQGKMVDISSVRAFAVMRQAIGGRTEKPVQFVIGGPDYETLEQWQDIMLQAIDENNPGLVAVDTDYKPSRPQIDVVIDYDTAAQLGVPVSEIASTLDLLFAGRPVSRWSNAGQEYDVIVEGEKLQLSEMSQLESVHVRSNFGAFVPLANLVSLQTYGAAQNLSRYNRVRAITISANLAPGYELGEALDYLNNLVREKLPIEANVDYKGQSRDLFKTGSGILFVFALGFVVVYLVLAAQFESFVHPWVILLSVPAAMTGGILGLWLTGETLNLFSKIGLIMLIGLASKNGILIVEFVNQLRDRGRGFKEAIVEASEQRFRPIVMTSLTTLAGTLPLVLGSGPGSETRQVIGGVILYGVALSSLMTLYFIPIAYQLLAKNTTSPKTVERELEASLKH